MNNACRVLLVDDEADTRLLLSRALTRNGLVVDCAANGKEALEHLTPQHHVIATDIIMPHMDGVALLQQLQACQSPIIKIVMTSFADYDKIKSVLDTGVDYILEKPFSASQLTTVINKLYKALITAADKRTHYDLFSDMFHRRLQTLPVSQSERGLISLVIAGATDHDIAVIQSISDETAAKKVDQLLSKLDISRREDLFPLLFPI